MIPLEEWNSKLFAFLTNKHSAERKVRLYVDRSILAQISGIGSADDALADFTASFRAKYSAGAGTILENAILDGRRWKQSSTFTDPSPPPILSTLVLTVLAVTEDKDHHWSVYRLLNRFLSDEQHPLESYSAEMPRGYSDVCEMFALWDQWILQFVDLYGEPLEWQSTPTHSHYTYQKPARSHAFIESRERQYLLMFFSEEGYSPGQEISGQQLVADFILWCRYDDSSFANRVLSLLDSDEQETKYLLEVLLRDELHNWDGTLGEDTERSHFQGTLYIDQDGMWQGIVQINERLIGSTLEMDGTSITLEDENQFLSVCDFPQSSSFLCLPSAQTVELQDSFRVRFSHFDFYLMQRNKYTVGDLCQVKMAGLFDVHTIILEHTNLKQMLESLESYEASFDEPRRVGNLVVIDNVKFSKIKQQDDYPRFRFRFPQNRHSKPILVGGLKLSRDRYLFDYPPRITHSFGLGEAVTFNEMDFCITDSELVLEQGIRLGTNRVKFPDGTTQSFELVQSSNKLSVDVEETFVSVVLDKQGKVFHEISGISQPELSTYALIGAFIDAPNYDARALEQSTGQGSSRVLDLLREYRDLYLLDPSPRHGALYRVNWTDPEFFRRFCLTFREHDLNLICKNFLNQFKKHEYPKSLVLITKTDDVVAIQAVETSQSFTVGGSEKPFYSFHRAGAQVSSFTKRAWRFLDVSSQSMSNEIQQQLVDISRRDRSNLGESYKKYFLDCKIADTSIPQSNLFDTIITWLSEKDNGEASFEEFSAAVKELKFLPPYSDPLDVLRQLVGAFHVQIDQSRRRIRVLKPTVLFQERTRTMGALHGGITMRMREILEHGATGISSVDYSLNRMGIHFRNSVPGIEDIPHGPSRVFISFPSSDFEVYSTVSRYLDLRTSVDVQDFFSSFLVGIEKVATSWPKFRVNQTEILQLQGLHYSGFGLGRRWARVVTDGAPGIYRYQRGKQQRTGIRLSKGEELRLCENDWLNWLYLFYFSKQLRKELRDTAIPPFHITKNSRDNSIEVPKSMRLPLVVEQFLYSRSFLNPVLRENTITYLHVGAFAQSKLDEVFHLDADSVFTNSDIRIRTLLN